MEGERSDGQGQLLCDWTTDKFMRDETTLLCYTDCGNILLMYQNKFQKF